MKQPMQPVVLAEDGVVRFHPNKIVAYLLDLCKLRGICDMNQLAITEFSNEDREQFAQLIGYSVSGFGELSYASAEMVADADAIADGLLKGS